MQVTLPGYLSSLNPSLTADIRHTLSFQIPAIFPTGKHPMQNPHKKKRITIPFFSNFLPVASCKKEKCRYNNFQKETFRESSKTSEPEAEKL